MAQLFWSDDLVTLYLGDCRDVLPELPDGGVDLVLTDPPYGVGVDYGEGLHDSEENWYRLHSEVMPQLLRISPRVLIFASQIRRLRWWYTSFPPDWLFCWYKGAVEVMAAHIGFSYWEPVLVYGKQVHAIGRR